MCGRCSVYDKKYLVSERNEPDVSYLFMGDKRKMYTKLTGNVLFHKLSTLGKISLPCPRYNRDVDSNGLSSKVA